MVAYFKCGLVPQNNVSAYRRIPFSAQPTKAWPASGSPIASDAGQCLLQTKQSRRSRPIPACRSWTPGGGEAADGAHRAAAQPRRCCRSNLRLVGSEAARRWCLSFAEVLVVAPFGKHIWFSGTEPNSGHGRPPDKNPLILGDRFRAV